MNWLGFRCIHCQQKLACVLHGLCSHCNKQIRRFAYCGHCGMELAQNTLYCGNCLHSRMCWDRIVIIGHYVDPLSSLIHRFKFQNFFFLDRTLARLLLLAIHNARRTHSLVLPEVIIPVPLHRLRHWQRGYNQSALIARYIANWLQIPCDEQLLQRIKYTHTQLGLTANARQKNLHNAFQINPKYQTCSYKSVALLDDVITTGSTLNEIVRVLRQVGIERIQVWGLAKT